MDIRRFYAEPKDVMDDKITISGREFNHITRVMRYKKGFKLIVSTGDGWIMTVR
jgi:16S rRNA U1498 N3-methylase RsmE